AAVLVAMMMLCGLASLFKSNPPKPAPSPFSATRSSVPPSAEAPTATGPPAVAGTNGPGRPFDPQTPNASDPEFAHLFPEQGTPFTGHLSGQWKLHLPSGSEQPVTISRPADLLFSVNSRTNLFSNGIYVIRGNRLIIEKPAEPRADFSQLWKLQWRIDDDSHL